MQHRIKVAAPVFIKLIFACGLCFLAASCQSSPDQPRPFVRDYAFDGSISRNVIESYLSRSITMMQLLQGWESTDENIRMLVSAGAKFAGRAFFVWGGETALPSLLPKAKAVAAKIHAMDPEMILQAGIFEIITPDVGRVSIPAWVFQEFGLEPEKRSFSYEAMLYKNGYGREFFGKNSSIPDMSQRETRMWFFYAAKSYIDIGIEAIHFGQVEIMDDNDPRHEHWNDMLSRVRAYAAVNARRHLVLCDAHVHGGIALPNGNLLFDFHSFPLRIEEVDGSPHQGALIMGHMDSLYGRSIGGVTPSGWKCAHLPYLVEFDNFEPSGKEGVNTGAHWIWGWDEITWLYLQSPEYRSEWLRYAWKWVGEHDPNGFLQMPGSRCLQPPRKWFFAAAKSPAIPDGIDLEGTIKQIWDEDQR